MGDVVSCARTKYLKMDPYRARFVSSLIKGRGIKDALLQLDHCNMKPGRLIKKSLMSAVANAEHNKGEKRDDLYISKICVDKGPFIKRNWSRNKGRVARVLKKRSHVLVELSRIDGKKGGN